MPHQEYYSAMEALIVSTVLFLAYFGLGAARFGQIRQSTRAAVERGGDARMVAGGTRLDTGIEA